MKKFFNFFKKNPQLVFIICIFLLSFFLRVFRLSDFISYHQDQVRDLFYVQNHFEQGKVILLGPKASVGDFFLPPFWYYLMSVVYFFSPSPLAPAFLVVVLNSLTVIVIYVFCQKFFDKKTAIFSSLLYAVSPLSIEYSRFAWNPNPIPFFTIAVFYFLYIYLYKKKNYGLWLGIICANIALQLHYQGIIVLTFFVLTLLITKKLSIKQFSQLIIINFILFLPFFVHEFKHNFENIKGIVVFLFKNKPGSDLKLFGVPFFIKFILYDFSAFIGAILFFKNQIFGFIGLLILGFSLLFIKSKMSSSRLLKLFLIFSFIMLFFYKNSLINFYLLFLIPIIIIYLIIIINDFLPKKIATVVIFLIVLLNLYFSPSFGKTDKTYQALKKAVSKISTSQDYCLIYDIFPQTFIEDKFRYLFSNEKNKPLKTNCLSDKKVKKIFYLCEEALCQRKKDILNNRYFLKETSQNTGVKIFELKL